MDAKIVTIGNSKGIRIPQFILKQCHIEEDVSLEIEKNKIIIKPRKTPTRKGWAEAFSKMTKNGDDRLLIDDVLDMETGEWEWT